MGEKLTALGFKSGRKDLDTPLPTELSLVWPDRSPLMGPRDFSLLDNPELHWFYDGTIVDPVDPAYIAAALTKGLDKQYIGILQSVGYTKRYKCSCGLVQMLVKSFGRAEPCVRCGQKIPESNLYLLIIFGRTRDRIARAANQRIQSLGGKEDEFIGVPALYKNVDDVTAAMMRDMENSQRRVDKPTDKGRRVQYHIEKGSPEDVICKAAGVGTMIQARNYLALLDAPEPVQRMVDKGQIPMSAKVEDVAAVEAAVEKHGRLTGKEVAEIQGEAKPRAMGKKEIQRWIASLPGDKNGAMIRAVLETVQGVGSMVQYPHLAPGEKK